VVETQLVMAKPVDVLRFVRRQASDDLGSHKVSLINQILGLLPRPCEILLEEGIWESTKP
jgi:hypothetical protein